MATSIARLAVHFAADVSGLKAGIAQVNQEVSKVGQVGASSAVTGLTSLLGSAGVSSGPFAAAAATFAAIAASIAAIASVGIPAAAAIERMQVKMEVLTGSAKQASDLVNSLRTFSANSPVSLMDAGNTASTLLAMGQEARFVAYEVEMLGDVALGTGQNVNELAQVFGQVMQAGRLTGNELRQFNERGIPLLSELSRMMGVSKNAIREMVEEGKVGADVVVEAFQRMTEAGGIFNGMSERINDTMSGQWDQLREKSTMAMSAIFEGPVGNEIVQWLKVAVTEVEALNDAIVTTKDGFLVIADFLAGAPFGMSIDATEVKASEEDRKKLAKAIKQQHIEMMKVEAARRTEEVQLKEAKKEQEALEKKMLQAAKAMEKSLRTPAEIFRDSVMEIQQLFDAALISVETYGRAIEGAKKSFTKSEVPQAKVLSGVAAVERGTTAAYSAIQQAKREQDAQVNQQREMLAVQKQQRKILEDILSETRNKKPVTVAKVDL